MKNNLSNNIFKLTVGSVFGKIIIFFSGVLIANVLEPEVYGQFNLLLSFTAFSVTISLFGLHSGLEIYLPKTKNKIHSNTILTYSILFCIVMTTIITFSILAVSNKAIEIFFDNKIDIQSYKLFLPSIFLLTLNTLLGFITRGNKDIKAYNLSTNFITPLIKIIVFYLIYILLGVSNLSLITFSYFASLFVSNIFLMLNMKKYGYVFMLEKKYLKSFKMLLKTSFPLLLSSILAVFINNIDVIMIGYYLSPVDVAVYKVSLMVGSLGIFFLTAVNTVFASFASDLYQKEKIEDLKEYYIKLTRYLLIFSLYFLMIIILLNQEIISIIGSGYIGFPSVIIIITLGQVFNSAVGSVGILNIVIGKSKYILYSNIIVLLLNLALNTVLIPDFGISGASISTAISIVFSNLFGLILMFKNLKFLPFNKLYFKSIIPFVLTYLLGKYIYELTKSDLFFRLFMVGIITTICFILLTIIYGTSKQEKKKIIFLLRKFILK